MRDALKIYVKERLAKHAYPREIGFWMNCPAVTRKVIRKNCAPARAENEGAE